MRAYLPTDWLVLALTAVLLMVTLLAGLALTRPAAGRLVRLTTWMLAVAACVAVERLTADQPPGFRMLAIIGALLFGMKAVVSVELQAAGGERLRPALWWAFAAGWFGMRPAVFAEFTHRPSPETARLIVSGLRSLLLGFLLVLAARLVDQTLTATTIHETTQRVLVAACLLPGLSLMLHFGLFNLVAGLWRVAGADCRALFRAPLASRSLTEFWGRRWNLAFTEMTAIAVYRPLCTLLGRQGAGTAAFLFSGVLHELAISVPVKAGYGLPLAYFVLHALAMQIEQRLDQTGRPISRRPWLGRLWTALWLVIPLPLLFHAPFLEGVVFPLIRFEGK